jgi:hypothetical protein
MPADPIYPDQLHGPERFRADLVAYLDSLPIGEPGEVAVGEPVAQVGWEQEGLVARCAQEVVGHGQSYLLMASKPNALILT